MVKRSFDEFELGRVLGVGTVGTIHEAYDTVNDVHVALKCLLPTVSSDQLIQARFAREMAILEKLSHANIVKYYGGGKHEAQLFFAMELLTGGSLKDALVRGGGGFGAKQPLRQAILTETNFRTVGKLMRAYFDCDERRRAA